MMTTERLTIEILPHVLKESPDFLDEIADIVTTSIKSRGWVARISTSKKQTFIEISKYDTKTASEILDSVQTIAKEFGVSPTAILDQLEKVKNEV